MTMKLIFELPDSLFNESFIVERVIKDKNNTHYIIEGKEICNDGDVSEWVAYNFGFITSDVTQLSFYDKIYHIIKCVQFAQDMKEKQQKEVEFLFNIYKGVFCIYWRFKENNF